MFRFERLTAARFLLVSALVCLGFAACSRQQVKGRMDPEDRLALADRLQSEGKCVRAVGQYEKLLSEFPTPQIAESAKFNLAVCHLDLEQFDLARTEFEDFIDSHPRSERLDNALYMVALSYLRAAPRPERDQTQTTKALNELLLLLREYPETDVRGEAEVTIGECKSRLAEKEYLAGELYLNMKDYRAAHVYFDSVIETYGDTAWAPRALFLKGRAYAGQERFEEARGTFQRVIDDFPGSEIGGDAARELRELEDVQPAGETVGSES